MPSSFITNLPNGKLLAHGKQSHVYVEPVIVKQIGYGKGLSRDRVMDLITHFHDYQQVLRQRGWLVPKCYFVCPRGRGRESIIMICERLIDGPSMVKLLTTQNIAQIMILLRPILRLLKVGRTTMIHYSGIQLHRLDYGVDLKPINLVLHTTTNKLVLVDTFAPKTIGADGSWRCYDTKFDDLDPYELMVVTATREGIILRLLRLMGISTTQGYNETFAMLKSVDMDKKEIQFIAHEVDSGYPLLDSIYQL